MPIMDLNLTSLGAISQKLDKILAALTNQAQLLQTVLSQGTIIIQQEKTMSTELDNLTAQVTANNSIEESAITLIQGLAQQISDNKNDPAALQALSDKLKAEDDKLAAAITANTPAPTPAPAPAT